MLECQSTDHSATQADDIDTTRLEQEPCTVIAAKGTTRRKRNVQQIDAEEQADRAANEIVDLVEQKEQRSVCQLTGPSLSPGMHIPAHSIATDTIERLAYPEQKEEAELSEWVLTESREMNREVTPPVRFFFRDQGGTTRWRLRAGGSHWQTVLYIL